MKSLKCQRTDKNDIVRIECKEFLSMMTATLSKICTLQKIAI
ncbi:hypothetical protein Bhyg_10350 [Pseudolycoriella hygida]|uniref:Uncharacterized protein n=1 Tax=Pseudolycoriella hygida TaxID=35572 RepID=A0A9Q0MTS9_9DIPT|nr:hypothetical protein Bhyg_10350 [Pseudolycoriella hygida]